ncbi:MAG: sulfotransferase family protein [Thiotrichaceae bacterium]|nr:MAG: sulfotransferase family protein [Thiotrichaceae bacterium]
MSNRGKEIQVTWISGMPRSGTTWLSQIFASSPDVRLKFCPLFSYEFKDVLDENSTAEDWSKFFLEVYQTNSEYLDQDYLRNQGLVPTFISKKENPHNLVLKSTRFHHLIPYVLRLDDQIRFIHIVRHPCATIYSWLANPHEFPHDADCITEWRTGLCRKTGPGEFWGFDDWKKVNAQALQLAELYPDRFKILRYENLVQDTRKCTKEIFEYLNIIYEKQTDDFIDLSHSKHDANKRSVFKEPVVNKNWLTMLDPSIISACLNEIKGTNLEQFL